MDISPIATAVAPTFGDTAATAEISSDFETFLKMLTVQLENQDPLNPVDSADYAVQLATFSGVEQQVQTNDLLKQLSGQLGTGSIAQMASWVGMEARSTAPAYFSGSPITVVPVVNANADTTELVVRDSSGIEVDRVTMPVGEGNFAWTGTTSDGLTLPNGQYQFETVSYANGVVIDQATSEVYGKVVEVQTSPNGALLILQGGAQIDATAVTALRES